MRCLEFWRTNISGVKECHPHSKELKPFGRCFCQCKILFRWPTPPKLHRKTKWSFMNLSSRAVRWGSSYFVWKVWVPWLYTMQTIQNGCWAIQVCPFPSRPSDWQGQPLQMFCWPTLYGCTTIECDRPSSSRPSQNNHSRSHLASSMCWT